MPTYKATSKIDGADAQNTIQEDTSPKLTDKEINVVQQFVRVCLYYGRAIDDNILPSLSFIASKQTIATENTMRRVIHLLNYLTIYPDAVILFRASAIILSEWVPVVRWHNITAKTSTMTPSIVLGPPFPLATKQAMGCKRRLLSLSVWVDSSL